MSDRILICTVGLPRSGKTTWSQRQGLPIVSPDSIRYALHGQRYIDLAEPFVWATARVMVRALFFVGHKTVILDATNTTRKARNGWVCRDGGPDAWETRFKMIAEDTEVCLERARAEKDYYIIPVIERMSAQFEPLEADELRWEELPRMMWEVGVEGDRFRPHAENPACVLNGCVPVAEQGVHS